MFFAEYSERSDSELKKKKVFKTHKVTCSACSRFLGSVIELEQVTEKCKHIFTCPCGNTSFHIKTTNKSYSLTEPDVNIIDVEKSTTSNIVTFKYKLGYHGK